MTTKTRYFVMTSLLVMSAGIGTGLVAYYVGIPAGVFTQQAGLKDLELLPADANLVAYANVREVMDSELRRKVRNALPIAGDGQKEIADRTGINIEADIDEVLVSLAPSRSAQMPASPLVLAHGRFDTSRIEGLMRQHGARVEEYKGARLIVAGDDVSRPSTDQLQASSPADDFSVAFVQPGMVAIGSRLLIRSAIDQKNSGAGVTGNADLMRLVRSFDGADAWAVGRFDALAAQARLPYGLSSQLPAITWFAANADVDTGVRGTLRADARDVRAADDLRDVIRGVIALARLQTGSQPQLKGLVDSLSLGGSGTTVSLAFDIPGEMVDMLESATGILHNRPNSGPGPR